MRRVLKWGGVFLYYIFAYHLPSNLFPIFGKYFRKMRQLACSCCFDSMGENVNV